MFASVCVEEYQFISFFELCDGLECSNVMGNAIPDCGDGMGEGPLPIAVIACGHWVEGHGDRSSDSHLGRVMCW